MSQKYTYEELIRIAKEKYPIGTYVKSLVGEGEELDPEWCGNIYYTHEDNSSFHIPGSAIGLFVRLESSESPGHTSYNCMLYNSVDDEWAESQFDKDLEEIRRFIND